MNGRRVVPSALLLTIALLLGWWVWSSGIEGLAVDPGPVVEPDTVFRQEILYACGDREIHRVGQAPPELHGLGISDIMARYPSAEGWSVSCNLPGELVVIRESGGFCAEHADYRHLGLYDDHVAVYEGPLGGQGDVLRVLELTVEDLPDPFRRRLLQTADFAAQSSAIQDDLRREMEFPDETALHAALENLDELRQD